MHHQVHMGHLTPMAGWMGTDFMNFWSIIQETEKELFIQDKIN
jgi:hypothetical protein